MVQTAHGRKRVPTWVWVLSAIFAACLLISSVLVATTLKAMKKLASSFDDPTKMERILSTTPVIPHPLPSGYTIVSGTELFNTKSVVLRHSPEPMIVCVSLVKFEHNIKDSRLRNQSFDTGFNMAFEASAGQNYEQKDTGSMKIDGHQFDYVTGFQNIKNAKMGVMHGKFSDMQDRIISIYVIGAKDKPVDIALISEFLKTLKPDA